MLITEAPHCISALVCACCRLSRGSVTGEPVVNLFLIDCMFFFSSNCLSCRSNLNCVGRALCLQASNTCSTHSLCFFFSFSHAPWSRTPVVPPPFLMRTCSYASMGYQREQRPCSTMIGNKEREMDSPLENPAALCPPQNAIPFIVPFLPFYSTRGGRLHQHSRHLFGQRSIP